MGRQQEDSYLRVPVWLVVILITIASGVILNGTATVYWAADFKRSFQAFKDETYQQKIAAMEKEIEGLKQTQQKAEEREASHNDLLTERQNDTRLRLAQKGIFTK